MASSNFLFPQGNFINGPPIFNGLCRSKASRRCFDDAKGTRFSSLNSRQESKIPKKFKKYDQDNS